MQERNADLNEIIGVTRLCAQIILENGGETYRAEETVSRVCRAFGFGETEVLALPTGVFITVSRDGVSLSTAIKRVKKRTVNLEVIEEVNRISRAMVSGDVSVAEARRQLCEISRPKPKRRWMVAAAAGLSSGFFTLLFGGDVFDFAASAFCGTIVQFVADTIKIDEMFNFSISILGGAIIALCSIVLTRLFGVGDIQKIITGAMMPLLPGIAMTNAIRDTLRGDLVSGVARAAEALLVAVSLVFGVGVVLKLYAIFF